ncbi:FAD-dependent monooxygenase [Mycobacterium malmoense]|uniref:FAD-binding domain-containing protein n=1 Tax=Mycobacterium malmoense TaxID=1780 RepID=A0ABX3SV77_MYCMA|nr:FAD-dependent monooxygenase [Mycobacterium malmoense]OIN79061.1 hypothetical protein BMG05_20000 [Mycobacterium malmoense]ORA84492.1 hypothetical protein BST29_05670 [Mycobacterium malmoense]QZA17151.1 FAD-dependent monooxygenase [Mycobacterium malmoense]UNB93942.1 FAD-dependent monooxygenase [Mycobacterium malmoense]
MTNQRVLISGAGVAGLTSAYWLHRSGFEVTVIERAPALRIGGQGIDIRGVAVPVAKRMGIYEAIQAGRTTVRGMSFVNRAGQSQVDIYTTISEIAQGDVEIPRGDLLRLLHGAADGARYLFGDEIIDLQQNDASVSVTFDKARPEDFDFVIGADGLHSKVRQLVFGDESQYLHYRGAYLSIFTVPNYLGLLDWGLLLRDRGRVAAIVTAPGNQTAVAAFIVGTPPVQFDYRDQNQQRRILAEGLADIGWEVPRLMQEAQQATDFYFDTNSQVRLEHWSHGRVVLAGDAAHCASPNSGQGTSLALVGGYVLAGELSTAAGDYARAFARYQDLLRDFVSRNHALAPTLIKQFVSPGPLMARAQLAAMQMLRNRRLRALAFSLAARPVTKASNALALPEYPG